MSARSGGSAATKKSRLGMDSDALPIPPEDLPAFRVAQLLVVLKEINQPINIERLGYYGFFGANPMLIDSLDTAERTALVMAGFDSRTIDHQSAAQRFANRRQRLRADVASLIAYGLAEARVENGAVLYGLTPTGSRASSGLTAAYADGLRQAISVVLPMLRRLSDRGLRQQATKWLRVQRLDLDLLGLEHTQVSEASS